MTPAMTNLVALNMVMVLPVTVGVWPFVAAGRKSVSGLPEAGADVCWRDGSGHQRLRWRVWATRAMIGRAACRGSGGSSLVPFSHDLTTGSRFSAVMA